MTTPQKPERKHKPEPTQPGNPNQFTIKQHIHSKASIKRFADANGLVSVFERADKKPRLRPPAHNVFCAQRVWDQKFEHGKLVTGIERGFLAESEAVINGAAVADHGVVNAYLALWQVRAELEASAGPDPVLNHVVPSGHVATKEEEEMLEKNNIVFVRGNAIPARFVAGLVGMMKHDRLMKALAGVKWGVLRPGGRNRFISADWPGHEAYIPLSPSVALAAKANDQSIADHVVDNLNRQSRDGARRFVFGNPADVASFHALHPTWPSS